MKKQNKIAQKQKKVKNTGFISQGHHTSNIYMYIYIYLIGFRLISIFIIINILVMINIQQMQYGMHNEVIILFI
jgi:hypothetical protein